jgi:hypothetical protein
MKIRWWDWLPFQSWRVVEIVEFADEVSARLPRNGVALVGSTGALKWVVFDCPCRSGHRIMLNMDPVRLPFWHVDARQTRKLTVMPSVDYADNVRRCHYFVRRGKIVWARNMTD